MFYTDFSSPQIASVFPGHHHVNDFFLFSFLPFKEGELYLNCSFQLEVFVEDYCLFCLRNEWSKFRFLCIHWLHVQSIYWRDTTFFL